MISGLYTLASGMVTQVARYEILANNLANSDTPGFKADQILVEPLTPGPDLTLPVFFPQTFPPSNVRVARHFTDYSQGYVRNTERPLDVALTGPGFFVVDTPDGERYTRAGNFTVDREGSLVTPSGHRVLGQGGPLQLRQGQVAINGQGQILENGQVVGTLRIVDFPRPYDLTKEAQQLFRPSDPAVVPQEIQGTVVGGHLESSNVGIVESMVTLIDTLRTFETYQKMIQSMDETVKQAANELGRA